MIKIKVKDGQEKQIKVKVADVIESIIGKNGLFTGVVSSDASVSFERVIPSGKSLSRTHKLSFDKASLTLVQINGLKQETRFVFASSADWDTAWAAISAKVIAESEGMNTAAPAVATEPSADVPNIENV